MKRTIVLILIVLITEMLIYYVIDNAKSKRLDEYYRSKTIIHENSISSALSAYEQIFRNVLNYKIDSTEVKNLIHGALNDSKNIDIYRNRLRMETQPIFESLKTIGLSHMQYHLPDGTSLLRMHKPFFYGDSLSDFRQTVVDANATGKLVQGYENGRHLLAYRFVFPLSMNGEHLGTVEMAVGLTQMIEALNRLYGMGYSYILEKEKVFKNYTIESIASYSDDSISETFIMKSCDACSIELHSGYDEAEVHEHILQSVNNNNKISSYEAFSEIYTDEHGDVLMDYSPVVTYNGQGVGYVIRHGVVQDYRAILNTYSSLFISVSMISLSIIFIIFAMDKSRSKIKKMNEQLERKVCEKVLELQNKDQFLMQQAKMATMGEMVTLILHQWKQPINSISMISDIALMDLESESSTEELKENLKNIKKQTQFMSHTGSDFLNFMKPSKEKTVFNVAEAVDELIKLFEFSFDRYNIGFEKDYAPDVEESANILGYKNEFKHVMLNFFNNSRDSIIEYRELMVEEGEDISKFVGLITVYIGLTGENVVVKVLDTGGGIPFHIIDKIFKKHFSTKADKGSGIGLYMSKEMVEKSMNGTIKVSNVIGGAEFTLTFPKA